MVVALAAVVAFSMAACSGTTSNNVTDAALTGLIKPLGALLS